MLSFEFNQEDKNKLAYVLKYKPLPSMINNIQTPEGSYFKKFTPEEIIALYLEQVKTYEKEMTTNNFISSYFEIMNTYLILIIKNIKVETPNNIHTTNTLTYILNDSCGVSITAFLKMLYDLIKNNNLTTLDILSLKKQYEEKIEKINHLIEDLKYSSPAEYFEEKSEKFKNEAKKYLKSFVIIAIITILFCVWNIFCNTDFANINLSNPIELIPYATITSILILLWLFSGNRYLENNFLANEMEQKHVLIYTYLALYKDLSTDDKQQDKLKETQADLLIKIFSISKYSKKGIIVDDVVNLVKSIKA